MVNLVLKLAVTVACARCGYSGSRGQLAERQFQALSVRVAERTHIDLPRVEQQALTRVAKYESGLRVYALNSRTKAYGLMQFMPKTWATTGIKKTGCPSCQIEAGLLYIKWKYKTPSQAFQAIKRHGRY